MVNLAIFRHTQPQSFKAGDVIFHEGDPGTVMYVISGGQVDILVGSQVVETAGPGSIVGEMALIDDSPRSATTIAKTDCELVAVDHKRFEFLVQQTPFFALEVMQVMSERLRRTDKLIASSPR
jgi:CRP/FNR family cyclic AMP-dependent transcriptional regulator